MCELAEFHFAGLFSFPSIVPSEVDHTPHVRGKLAMNRFVLRRFVAVGLLSAIVASVAVGYIHFPPTSLPKMCKESTMIRVLTVKKHDPEKGIIVYDVAEVLKKSEVKAKSFRHVIPKDLPGIRPLTDWVAEGKTAVMFTIEGTSIACGYVFIDDFCYSVDYSFSRDVWSVIRVDPELAASYFGKAEDLKPIVKSLLLGNDVKVPVHPTIRHMTIPEREKAFKAVNDRMTKSRD
jgi:hypothetical protein